MMSEARKFGLRRFLRRLLDRSTLSAEEQHAILSLPGQVRSVRSRQDLVMPGERVEHAVLVVDGLCGRFDQMRDGSQQINAIYIAGDMCDIHSVASPRAGWGITTIASGTILLVPHEDINRLAVRYNNIALALWRDTTLDASILAKWVANAGRKDARSRLAHLFCEVGVRMERAGLDKRTHFRLDVTQARLSDVLGLTPVHVNRTLQSLRAEQVLSMDKHVVDIADWDALACIAEFDPAYLLLDGPLFRWKAGEDTEVALAS